MTILRCTHCGQDVSDSPVMETRLKDAPRTLLVNGHTLYHGLRALQRANMEAITTGEGAGLTTIEMAQFLYKELAQWRITVPERPENG